MKKYLLGLLLFVFSINAATTLSAGDIVILAINGDTDATYGRGFTFMPLVHLEAGTEIYFTDYGWSDLAGAFINSTAISDVFVKYTVPAGGVTAGTVIRNATNSTTNFTFYFAYGISTYDYVNIVGVAASDEVLAFQGSIASPTFLFAASYVSTAVIASGWATSVAATGGTNGVGSALPGTGNGSVADLVDDYTALSFNQAADANDNCAYTGPTTAATMAEWRNRVSNYANWTFNDAIPIPTPPSGPFEITDALPVELTSFSASVEQNKVTLNWQTATEVNNYGFEVERTSPRPSPYQGEGVQQLPDGRGWETIGFIEGAGNSNSPKSYSFVDNQVASTTLSYRLKQIDIDGKFTYSKEITVEAAALPTEFALSQNYPNPFNPVTTIKYAIPEKASRITHNVSLVVYNLLGQEVATLVNEQKPAGNYEVKFDASNLASGIYLYKLQTGEFSSVKKLILMK